MNTMSGTGGDRPKSMRQKQVLGAARENPDATVDEIAEQVPSATAELVQVVLNEYGDPAAPAETPTDNEEGDADEGMSNDGEPVESTADNSTATHSDNADTAENSGQAGAATPPGSSLEGIPPATELSEKQQAVLEAIAADPTATQRELADELGVSAATVSNRVNSIPGFNWSDRESFAKTGAETQAATTCSDGGQTAQAREPTDTSEPPHDTAGSAEAVTTGRETDEKVEKLRARVEALEADPTDNQEAAGKTTDTVLSDPELVHKVIHACLNSDTISEDEELRIINALVTS